MTADLIFLAVLLLGLKWIKPLAGLDFSWGNLGQREQRILLAVVAASLLGWLSIFIHNDFRGFTETAPGTETVRGQ